MASITFDTHKFIRTPQASGISEDQAERSCDDEPGIPACAGSWHYFWAVR